MTRRFVRYGVSPRGLQALILTGKVRALLADRVTVSCQDIREVAHAALRHRIIRNFEAEAEGIATDAVIDSLMQRVAEPAAA
jgi:MoxR-like ATPase